MIKKILTSLGIMLSFSDSILLYAQDAAAPKAQADWSPMLGIVLMLGVFFFLIILPQSRKAKKQTEFLSSLKRGDAVITLSGLYGRIYGIADKVITLEIAPNVRIRVDRQSISAKDTTPGESSKEKMAEGA